MKAMFVLPLFLMASSLLIAKDYSDPRGFKVSFPEDWSIAPHMYGTNALAAPSTTDKNAFLKNANILTDHLGQSSLEEYYNASMKKVEESVANYKLEDSGSTTIGGREAKWAIYQATIEGVSGKVLQYMIRNGKQVVLITGVDGLDQFNADRATFESIASSIHFDREVITPQRDAAAPALRKEILPAKMEQAPQKPLTKPSSRRQSFPSIPGDADMPARLYYQR